MKEIYIYTCQVQLVLMLLSTDIAEREEGGKHCLTCRRERSHRRLVGHHAAVWPQDEEPPGPGQVPQRVPGTAGEGERREGG